MGYALIANASGDGFDLLSADHAVWFGYLFPHNGRWFFEAPSVRCNRDGYATLKRAVASLGKRAK